MSNHLDVGFTGFVRTVINEYFDDYFPAAIETAQSCAAQNISYKYMTHSFLISLYFDCPPNAFLHCPTEKEVSKLKSAIEDGFIYWHSFPFNSNLGAYDESMIEFGLNLSKDLALRNNINPLLTMSQRDVPGMTRSIIPILTKNQIRAISIGVNEGSAPPNVPNIFKWRDKDSDTEIIGMLHKGGYGGLSVTDSVILPNFDDALVMAWNQDNAGPPSLEEVESWYKQIYENFPNATNIFASTFDEYLDALAQREDVMNELPIIDAEMGDTWAYGIPSDPLKLAMTRSAQRKRAQCIHNTSCSCNAEYSFSNFSRFLLKNFEHTWGGSVDIFLHRGEGPKSSYYAWSNEDFHRGLFDEQAEPEWFADFTNLSAMWNEQRMWGLDYALDALAMSNNTDCIDLHDAIMSEWEYLKNAQSPMDVFGNDWFEVEIVDGMQFSVNNNEYLLSFDYNHSGAINKLFDLRSNLSYASSDHLLGRIIYQTLTESDFDQSIGKEYAYMNFNQVDFGKYGLNNCCNKEVNVPSHEYIETRFVSLYKSHKNDNAFLLELDFGQDEAELIKNYGIPQTFYVLVDFAVENVTFSMEIIWINKTVTRMAESIFIEFDPLICTEWKAQKMGKMQSVDADVMMNGSFHSMPFENNMSCHQDSEIINILSKDAGFAVFTPKYKNLSSTFIDEFTPFPTPFVNVSATDHSIGYVLYNNIWGTNYIQWYPYNVEEEQNSTFRFEISLNGNDVNGDDEKVSADELRCGLEADKNHNGMIDAAEEMKAFAECLKRRSGYDMNGHEKVSVKEFECGLYADKNHNGKIDKEEVAEFDECLKQKETSYDFESYKKQFVRLFDMNNDGKLNKEELKRAKLAWKLARIKT